MKIGLFFGSFNPIHVGHLIIANHLVEHSDLDKVWFVVTPHNPFKKKSTLLDNYQRLEMVYRATKDYDTLSPSDIEFNLLQPNYTINTLAYLEEKFTDYQVCLIMCDDNLKCFQKWRNHELILEQYHSNTYRRLSEGSVATQCGGDQGIHHIHARIMELS